MNKYIGARYIPLHCGEWDKTKRYEALSVVTYQGNSFTSLTYVPSNVEITDKKYWVRSGNFNSQLATCEDRINEFEDKLITKASTADLQLQQNRINNVNATVTSHTTKINDLITRDNDKEVKINSIDTLKASKQELATAIADAQLSSSGVDTSSFADKPTLKKSFTEKFDSSVNVFNKADALAGYITNLAEINDGFHHTKVLCMVGDVIRFTESATFGGQYGCHVKTEGTIEPISSSVVKKDSYNEYTVPSGVKEVILNIENVDTFMVTVNETYPSDYKEFYNVVKGLRIESESLPIIPESKLPTSITLANDVDYMKLFSKICCIGDSLTEGDYGADSVTNEMKGIHGYNYPFALSRLNNCSVTNLGRSGFSAKQWWNRRNDGRFTSEQLDFSRYDCFFILLVQNGDMLGDMSISSDSDVGAYCNIIEKINNENPNASIFLLTNPQNIAYQNGVSQSKNETVKAIARHYSDINVKVIDICEESELLTLADMAINQPYDKALHYGKVGSLRLASEVMRLTNKAIKSDLGSYNVIDS